MFLRTKAAAAKSDRYVSTLKVSITAFCKGRMATPLADLTVQDLERWIDNDKWGPTTQGNYLADVRCMLNWAVKRGLVSHNPARLVEAPEPEDSEVIVHSPEEVKSVLEFARDIDLNLCRALAVRYFGGLRSAEVNRLAESRIKQQWIEVPAKVAKCRQRRLVTLTPNLAAWLALGGQLPLTDVNNRMRWFSASLRQKRGIAWPHNVTRHSYCSYKVAKDGAKDTALEAGHSEQMLFTKYRAVVTPEAAAAYWAIVP